MDSEVNQSLMAANETAANCEYFPQAFLEGGSFLHNRSLLLVLLHECKAGVEF
jgi:hypothetical protein